MNTELERLIVVLGPTASGKTGLSIQLAQNLKTEIISGDSMLIYQGFDIGSAKPTLEEKAGIVHHMIDILPPEGSFNVKSFLDQVKELITDINKQGKIPILAGGTGLYIQSLLEGYALAPQSEDPEYRRHLEELVVAKGGEYVHQLLADVNPEAAQRLHVNDMRRIIRALEVHHLGGSEVSQKKSGHMVYDAYVVGLNWERSKLYQRINQRVTIMEQQGLVQEVQNLLAQGISPDAQAMKGIGYKELVGALTTGQGMAEALDKVRQNSRHFAKRQVTWYRRMPYIHWYQPELYQGEGLLDNVLGDIRRWAQGPRRLTR